MVLGDTVQAKPVHTEPAHFDNVAIEVPKQLEQVELPQLQEKSQALAAQTIPTSVSVQPTPSGDVETIIRQAARKYGVDENYLVRIARCESTLNPNSVNRNYYDNGHPSGLFQHISGYWPARAAKYGWSGASVFDAQAQAEVTAQMFRDGLQHLWECK